MMRSNRAGLLGAVVLALTACASDMRTAPEDDPNAFAIESGNDQRAAAGEALPLPLVVRARDGDGRPLAGVTVTFTAEDGGSVAPSDAITDAAGRASARWTLGPAIVPGMTHRARAEFAHAGRTATLRFTARTGDAEPPPPAGLRVLTLATYDGSGQTVHPDVLPMPTGLFGSAAWLMAVTPYPWGDATHENPSVFTGPDGFAFAEPQARLNPVARPAAGHLSDPDVVRDPVTNRLRLYYREASDRNRIWLIESQGIGEWSTPRLVASGPNHTIVSPAVVRAPNGEWRMYAIDGEGGCSAANAWLTLRRSADGITWGPAQRLSLDQPGFSPWHVDVQWIPERGEYWALYNAKSAGGCATTALYLATSPDGERWTTYPSPVLTRGAISAFADIVYRASFHYDGARDLVTIWHSGARYAQAGYRWSSAVETRTRSTLFADVRRKGTGIPDGTPGAPPLADWP